MGLLSTVNTEFGIKSLDKDNNELNSLMLIGLAQSNPENYPHYGKYGRDMFNCSATVEAGADGKVCYQGICVDIGGAGSVTISCTNCAWDCNAKGANNTCDPKSC